MSIEITALHELLLTTRVFASVGLDSDVDLEVGLHIEHH